MRRAAFPPGTRVRHVYDGATGTVVRHDPRTGMLELRFQDGTTDHATPADVVRIGIVTRKNRKENQKTRMRDELRFPTPTTPPSRSTTSVPESAA